MNLPIFFSSLRLAEAGRTCPEVRGGETGRGTRATVRGTQKTEPRARGAGDAGAGPRVRVRVRDAEHGRRGRGARDAKRGTRGRGRGHGGTGCRTQDAGRRTRATGRGQQNTGNGGTKCRRRKTRARGAGRRTRATGRGQQNTGNAGTGRRRRGTSPRAWTAARLHTPARPRNNLPGPFTAGRLPPRAAATCRAYESESRRCRRARRTCCCRAAPRPT